jgi:hypothetical protein
MIDRAMVRDTLEWLVQLAQVQTSYPTKFFFTKPFFFHWIEISITKITQNSISPTPQV